MRSSDSRMIAPCLMVQGTASGVGKSVLTTAFCRIFARAGYRVAPFKSQNMSLNASVTADGGEIGRAQAAQAEAAGIEPTVDMNPILLKPESEHRSQLIVRGVARGSLDFYDYSRMKPALVGVVEESLNRLRLNHDLVIIEGAGSPAEINLRDEIVNMSIARMANAAVLLVGDIERGGLFAALVGTMELLDPDDRRRVEGFIVNKLRGDLSLLTSGFDFLLARTGIPVLGVVPHFFERLVPAEDSLGLDEAPPSRTGPVIDIAVVRLPWMANFDDFEPLGEEPGVRVRFIRTAAELDGADLIILPGTKSTASDLGFLRESGVGEAITAWSAEGRALLGICGGYQMLGIALHDPHLVESWAAVTPGLGLLPVVTTFNREKTTERVRARVTGASAFFSAATGKEVNGYEIHMGTTESHEASRPFEVVERRGTRVDETDGAVGAKGNVLGTSLHGLFENNGLRRALLTFLAEKKGVQADQRWGQAPPRRARYDRLADIVEASVDLPAIAKLTGLSFPKPCA